MAPATADVTESPAGHAIYNAWLRGGLSALSTAGRFASLPRAADKATTTAATTTDCSHNASCAGADWPTVMGALAMLASATTASGLVCAWTPVHQQPSHSIASTHRDLDEREGVPAYCRRKITNTTALRYMHVTQDMAACLRLDDDRLRGVKKSGACLHGTGGFDDASHAAAAAAATDPAGQPPLSGQEPPRHRRLFQCALTLCDPAGQEWPVLFEATLSCRQYHRRLTQGWRDFCRQAGVQTGDVIEFRPGSELGTLAVRVIKRRRG